MTTEYVIYRGPNSCQWYVLAKTGDTQRVVYVAGYDKAEAERIAEGLTERQVTGKDASR